MIFKSVLHRLPNSRFLRFAAVGATGFLVNEATLLLAHGVCGVSPYASWFIAFAVAVTFTWWGNRNLTFADKAKFGLKNMIWEWMRFVATQSVGATVNFIIYSLLIHFSPIPLSIPYVALVIGILVGLIFNFKLSKMVVFR
jgi:putative flippase GtrA